MGDGAVHDTASHIEQHMQVLADERMQGRLTGTAEYAHAAQYVSEVMARQGARPVIGRDFQVRFGATLTRTSRVALGLYVPGGSVATPESLVGGIRSAAFMQHEVRCVLE